MTTEQNESPVPETQGQVQNSTQPQGQGVAHRRRRRRRNKGQTGAPQAKAQAGNAPANGQNAQPAQTAPAQRPPKQQQPKRFFPKSNAGNGNGNGNYPGNGRSMQNGSGGGARRKGKGRRQQTFVGPMDHSYRGGANGNIAESGSSNGNMEFRGMPHSGFYAEGDMYGAAPVAPVREDAPTKIYCFIEDLFLVAKIQEVSRKLGIKIGFVKADKDIVARLAEGGEDARPSLIVFDLNNVGAKPLSLIPKLKTKFKRGTSVIGFLSHLQGDLKVKAIEAGCDMVMPRSAFSQNLPNLLRRHGIEEQQEEMEAIEA
ncbi:MAG: response regulator [Acidobacteriaceae bacterium]